jgi:hypothetical protein
MRQTGPRALLRPRKRHWNEGWPRVDGACAVAMAGEAAARARRRAAAGSHPRRARRRHSTRARCSTKTRVVRLLHAGARFRDVADRVRDRHCTRDASLVAPGVPRYGAEHVARTAAASGQELDLMRVLDAARVPEWHSQTHRLPVTGSVCNACALARTSVLKESRCGGNQSECVEKKRTRACATCLGWFSMGMWPACGSRTSSVLGISAASRSA